jgi:hypothetical protein
MAWSSGYLSRAPSPSAPSCSLAVTVLEL